MTLVKHEIPLLEYDDDKDAVVSPRHENLPIALPERAAYVFSEQAVERYAEKTGAKIVAHFESATKLFPVYVVEYKGTDICLAPAPVGAAAAAQSNAPRIGRIVVFFMGGTIP